jgi:hypothetical protein
LGEKLRKLGKFSLFQIWMLVLVSMR